MYFPRPKLRYHIGGLYILERSTRILKMDGYKLMVNKGK